MDQQVFLIIDSDEYYVGTVAEILKPNEGDTRQVALILLRAVRFVIDEMVYETAGGVDASGDYTKEMKIELR